MRNAANRLPAGGSKEVDRARDDSELVAIIFADPDGHWLELIHHPIDSQGPGPVAVPHRGTDPVG